MQTAGRSGEGRGYALTSDDDDADFWGSVQETEGLFTPLPEGEGVRRVRLLGCLPQGGLLKGLGRIGSRRATVGNAWFDVLDADADPMGSYFAGEVTVVAGAPSARGAGLVDITVTLRCESALPGAESFWGIIRAGRLDRTGMWHGLAPADRRAWLSVALLSRAYRRRGKPHAPAGHVFALDGRQVVDIDSFYCAMGEAVNGPGGYFGWNLDALDDCLRGSWGATAPFTLIWSDSETARKGLGERVSGDGGTSLFELLLQILEERGVDVLLR
ncbi:barstar family protein [Streptomyces sp. NPDC058382]|uniref:barstar family protein n=1 Tax=unclassified Streptomyces TaxID=2593676 RepID=UPI003637E5F5